MPCRACTRLSTALLYETMCYRKIHLSVFWLNSRSSRTISSPSRQKKRAAAAQKTLWLLLHPRNGAAAAAPGETRAPSRPAFENRALPSDWPPAAPPLAAGGQGNSAPSPPATATSAGLTLLSPTEDTERRAASPPLSCAHPPSPHRAAVTDPSLNRCLLLFFSENGS